jgi:hypothetical protein
MNQPLSPEERYAEQQQQHEARLERLKRVAALRRGGSSLRAIATAERVSLTRICDDLDAARALGLDCNPTDGRIEGRDGRSHPATK